MAPHHSTRSRGDLPTGVVLVLVASGAALAQSVSLCLAGDPLASEAPFLAENQAAMDRMMAGMAVRPTGDVARDFVEMMIPHHQGAIDMAQAYLRHGRDEQLRRIAQEIVVEQAQEIAAMRLAVGDPLPPSAAAPTQSAPAAEPGSDPTGSAPGPSPGAMIHQHGMSAR